MVDQLERSGQLHLAPHTARRLGAGTPHEPRRLWQRVHIPGAGSWGEGEGEGGMEAG